MTKTYGRVGITISKARIIPSFPLVPARMSILCTSIDARPPMAHNATGMTYDVPQSVDQGIDLGLLKMLSTVDLIDTQLRFDGTAHKRLTTYNLE